MRDRARMSYSYLPWLFSLPRQRGRNAGHDQENGLQAETKCMRVEMRAWETGERKNLLMHSCTPHRARDGVRVDPCARSRNSNLRFHDAGPGPKSDQFANLESRDLVKSRLEIFNWSQVSSNQ